MHDYKTTVPSAGQDMSHTILKSRPQQSRCSNTLLNEVTGTFEVYWEQLISSAKERWGKGGGGKNGKNTTKTGYEEAPYNSDEERSFKPRKSNRPDPKSKFIEANVVFG